MATPVFKLEEQLHDARSDQIAYKLTIENHDPKPISIDSIQPKIPTGATLVEVTDTSLTEVNARKAELVAGLNELLNQFLTVVSADFRKELVARNKELFMEIASISGTLQTYAKWFVNPRYFEARAKRLTSIFFRISSFSDAQSAYARWMKDSSNHQVLVSLFEAKAEQLKAIEEAVGSNAHTGLTIIEPDSFFTATYVLKFSRDLMEPRKYQLSFDVTYSSPDLRNPQRTSTATNVQISPLPVALNCVSVLGALLGALLRFNLSAAPINASHLITGPVLALIFFNIYEFTAMGKQIDMPLSWRSALLIGALCGLAQDRVLAAISAFIGG